MKKIIRYIFLFILVLFVGAIGAVVYWAWPKTTVPPSTRMLVADYSKPLLVKRQGAGKFITLGRLEQVQKSRTALANFRPAINGSRINGNRTVKAEFPQGATLTFDLYIPPALLMDPFSAINFIIEAGVEGQTPSRVFEYTYRQDWIGFAVEWLLAKTHIHLTDLDRFRHFTVDLSSVAGKTGELVFRIEGEFETDRDMEAAFRGSLGARYHNGLTYFAPRLWSNAEPKDKDFSVALCVIEGLSQGMLEAEDAPATPNIDALKEKGVSFTNAFAPSNSVNRSIPGMMAGRYPSMLGLATADFEQQRFEQAAFRLVAGGIRGSTPAMPRYFNRAGYDTAYIGANPFAVPGSVLGADYGFASVDSYHNPKKADERIAEKAVAFIENSRNTPFFLYTHFKIGPMEKSKLPKFPSFRKGKSEKEKLAKWNRQRLVELDMRIGQLLTALETAGISDKTLIALTSSNGQSLESGHPAGSGNSLYDSQTKVPLILVLPGKLPAGKSVSTPVSLYDLYPTILALRDEPYRGLVEPEKKIEIPAEGETAAVGESQPEADSQFQKEQQLKKEQQFQKEQQLKKEAALKDDTAPEEKVAPDKEAAPAIEKEEPQGLKLAGQSLLDLDKLDAKRAIALEGPGMWALRTADYKVIVKFAPYDGIDPDKCVDHGKLVELYDLQADPGETKNLARTGVEVEDTLIGKLIVLDKLVRNEQTKQKKQLRKLIGVAAKDLYPNDKQEAFEVQISPGGERRIFQGMIRPARAITSMAGQGLDPEDSIIKDDDGGEHISFVYRTRRDQPKYVFFTPFPPDDPFEMTILVDGQLLEIVHVGPYSIEYPGAPFQVKKERDLRLMTTEATPDVDFKRDLGVFVLRGKPRVETVQINDQRIARALQEWGYIK